MTQRPLPGTGAVPEVNYTCNPNHLSAHPDLTPYRRAVLDALIICAADDYAGRLPGADGYCTTATKSRVMEIAHCGVSTLRFSLAWLVEVGAIEVIPDPEVVSRRRIVLLWRRRSSQSPPSRTAHGGARVATPQGAPDEPQGRATQHPKARQARPSTYRGNESPKSENTVTSAPPPAEGLPMPRLAVENPTRHGTVSPPDGERMKRARQLRLNIVIEEGIHLLLADKEGHKIRCDRFETLKPEVQAELKELKPELIDILSKEARLGPEPTNDGAMPYANLCEMIRAGEPPAAVAFAMACRYRDHKPETLKCWQGFVGAVGVDELIGYLTEAEDKSVKDKARFLSKRASEARKRRKAM